MAVARKGDLAKATRLQLNLDRFGKGNYLAVTKDILLVDFFGWVEIERASREY
jgi:hypothetical protein